MHVSVIQRTLVLQPVIILRFPVLEWFAANTDVSLYLLRILPVIL